MAGLSVILRGTTDDRLNWAFNLYDLNKDGCITKEVCKTTEELEGGVRGPEEGSVTHRCITSRVMPALGPWPPGLEARGSEEGPSFFLGLTGNA